jgi:hypothetical protein
VTADHPRRGLPGVWAQGGFVFCGVLPLGCTGCRLLHLLCVCVARFGHFHCDVQTCRCPHERVYFDGGSGEERPCSFSGHTFSKTHPLSNAQIPDADSLGCDTPTQCHVFCFVLFSLFCFFFGGGRGLASRFATTIPRSSLATQATARTPPPARHRPHTTASLRRPSPLSYARWHGRVCVLGTSRCAAAARNEGRRGAQQLPGGAGGAANCPRLPTV